MSQPLDPNHFKAYECHTGASKFERRILEANVNSQVGSATYLSPQDTEKLSKLPAAVLGRWVACSRGDVITREQSMSDFFLVLVVSISQTSFRFHFFFPRYVDICWISYFLKQKWSPPTDSALIVSGLSST